MANPESTSPPIQNNAALKDANGGGEPTEPRPIDESYKRFFSHRTMVRHLLQGFVPGKWQRKLDLSTLEPMPTNFVSDLSRQRYCDVVWRVKWKNSREWVYVYLLIEFQARPDRFMAARLMVYEGLLLQALSKLPEYSREGALLPAIVPIVLYNGQERWKMPLRLSRLMEPLPEELSHLQAELVYILLDEGAFEAEELAAMRNLVAILFRLEYSSSTREVEDGLLALNEELEASGDAELGRAFEIWLEQILKRRFPDIDVGQILGREGENMLAQKLDEWYEDAERRGLKIGEQRGLKLGEQRGLEIGEQRGLEIGEQRGLEIGEQRGLEIGEQRGLEIGEQRGLEKGRQDLILDLIGERFGPPTQDIRRRLTAITSPEELTRLAARVFEVSSPEELWAD